MSKMIAVWGAPNCGKTTFSVKLAETIYRSSGGKSAVIVVFADSLTPTLPVVFPKHIPLPLPRVTETSSTLAPSADIPTL